MVGFIGSAWELLIELTTMTSIVFVSNFGDETCMKSDRDKALYYNNP